jgi:hypothetical protein
MFRMTLCSVPALALAFCTSGAGAAGIGVPTPVRDRTAVVQRVHSVYEAEESLRGRGYYDVRLERASLPYSFNACKRGVRYHIHVNWYGDLVQVDPLGPCGGNGDGYYGRRRYYEDEDDGGYYNRYRHRPRYYN